MSEAKLLHSTRWLNLVERDGWIYATRRKSDAPQRIDALSIVAFHEEGGRRRLVMIEEWRASVEQWVFGLPAGLVEEGEPLLECARRELQEETGLDTTWAATETGTLLASPGLTDESFCYVFAGCEGTPSENPGVDNEQIRVHLLDRQGCRDLLRLNQEGRVLEGRCWTVLFSIAQTGAIGKWAVE